MGGPALCWIQCIDFQPILLFNNWRRLLSDCSSQETSTDNHKRPKNITSSRLFRITRAVADYRKPLRKSTVAASVSIQISPAKVPPHHNPPTGYLFSPLRNPKLPTALASGAFCPNIALPPLQSEPIQSIPRPFLASGSPKPTG
ncbi:Uncharacterized protein HZ326_2575 [Fusarium oxysporum f. sp. albedinis]|nr:Uncharacterized protein HZ326_2575 [Fusarium oxysporum f. sp. albedinis]